ncbi:DUF4834 family protein [Flavobacterium sp.]|uniref:DUF4834 family protein n=1 Tax=Flavobacterium sp. TaxID=239 RepID=UPI003D1093E1
MQEASLVGLVKNIIWIIGVYYFIKIVAKLLMPILMRKVVEKAQNNFNRQYQQNTYNTGQTAYNQEPEKQPKDFSKPTKQVGEYVDFEEIKE